MRVEYHPEIAHDLKQISNFYNERSQGLGAKFLDEFEMQVLNIASRPNHWSIVENDIRRAVMKRFPYVIYFRSLKDEVLRVTVVKHQRRHPNHGFSRQ